MKKMLAALAALVTAVCLVACAPLQGTVTEKTYKPDNSGYQYTYGLNPSTGKYDYGYRYVSDPACYGLHTRTDEGKNMHRCVSKNFWENTEVGDYISAEDS